MIILDGLNDSPNEDVLRIIEGRKLMHCNILATARPHSTMEIHHHFQTIVIVNGFTEEKAEDFATKILNNKAKARAVLDFNPADRQGVYLWEYHYSSFLLVPLSQPGKY